MKTRIYRITHIKNLDSILQHGCLWCDNGHDAQNLSSTGIAHQHIKNRRSRRRVPLGPGGTLADYVPFYFASRSPMLYAIHRGRVASYTDGQTPVLHLVSSVEAVKANDLPFVFTDGHAEIAYSKFYDDTKDIDQVDWNVMNATYWNDTNDDGDCKRRQQAVFLVHRSFPFSLIAGIGVYSAVQVVEVKQILDKYRCQTPVAEGGSQGQMINLLQTRHTQDERIGVGRRLAAPARARRLVPSGNDIFADPQRETSTPDKGWVILFPVAETVGAFGFLLFHTKRIPALPSP